MRPSVEMSTLKRIETSLRVSYVLRHPFAAVRSRPQRRAPRSRTSGSRMSPAATYASSGLACRVPLLSGARHAELELSLVDDRTQLLEHGLGQRLGLVRLQYASGLGRGARVSVRRAG